MSPAGQKGVTQVEITVNSPPSAGILHTDESTHARNVATNHSDHNRAGTLFDTEFSMRATGFSDANLPLLFQFGYKIAPFVRKETVEAQVAE